MVSKKEGYTAVLIYFWLESIDLAKARVKSRVEKGGHNIPVDVIERRYKRGLDNFFKLYKNISSRWIVYDNSHESPMIIAAGSGSIVKYVYNDDLWRKIELKK